MKEGQRIKNSFIHLFSDSHIQVVIEDSFCQCMHATKLYWWPTGTMCVYKSCGEAAPMLMAAAWPPLGGGGAVRGPGLLINKPKEFNFGLRSAPVHPSLIFPHGHFYVSNG